MILALRHTLPPDAPRASRIGVAVIEARLVTRYAHAGIVIGDTLYHATAAKGVHKVQNLDLTGWLLLDLGVEYDQGALALFNTVEGAGYDWVSLAAFIVSNSSDSQRWYCFELVWLLMTGAAPKERITAEDLIVQAMLMGGRLLTPPPPIRSVA